MTEQHPDSLLEEVKVPIFCEFIYQQNLASSNVDDDNKPFYKHIVDSIEKGNSYDFSDIVSEYSLPGFPGINYFFYVYVDEENGMIFDFKADFDYITYLYDVNFTCTINNNEPKQYHYTLDSEADEEPYEMYLLFRCSNECAGCAACKDKNLVVRVEGIITVKHVDHLWIKLDVAPEDYKLYDDNDTKDFVFVVEGKEIWVHKSILIKNSTVFSRMLDSEKWKETTENKINIPEFSFEYVEIAIKACYTLTDYSFLDNEDYLMLFRFADKYDMDNLKNMIKKHIVVTPSTVVKYANFLLKNNFDELVDWCIDYILVCSQSSLPIKDIEMLDPQIQSMFFSRTLISPAQKKDLKLENRTVYKDKK